VKGAAATEAFLTREAVAKLPRAKAMTLNGRGAPKPFVEQLRRTLSTGTKSSFRMDNSAEKDPRAGEAVIARALKERRRFRRVHLAVAGRLFVPATQEETVCTIEDISPGDAAVLCQLQQEPHGRVVIYLESMGRFEGPIVRRTQAGFVMAFSCSLQKRERLADQLTVELNRHLLSENDLRRYDRVEAASGSYTHFTRSTGDQVRCEVLDLSLTGISVRCDTRPPVGEHILIGHRAGRVARHHNEGIGIELFGMSTAVKGDEFAAVAAPTTINVPRAVAPLPLKAAGGKA
jgi:hypothetical protein